jgi:hypothetical protein
LAVCCECGDEPSGSGVTALVKAVCPSVLDTPFACWALQISGSLFCHVSSEQRGSHCVRAVTGAETTASARVTYLEPRVCDAVNLVVVCAVRSWNRTASALN